MIEVDEMIPRSGRPRSGRNYTTKWKNWYPRASVSNFPLHKRRLNDEQETGNQWLDHWKITTILAINETKPKTKTELDLVEFQFKNYTIFASPKFLDLEEWGTIIFIHSTLANNVVQVNFDNNLRDCCFIKLNQLGKKSIFGSVYRHWNETFEEDDWLQNLLKGIQRKDYRKLYLSLVTSTCQESTGANSKRNLVRTARSSYSKNAWMTVSGINWSISTQGKREWRTVNARPPSYQFRWLGQQPRMRSTFREVTR